MVRKSNNLINVVSEQPFTQAEIHVSCNWSLSVTKNMTAPWPLLLMAASDSWHNKPGSQIFCHLIIHSLCQLTFKMHHGLHFAWREISLTDCYSFRQALYRLSIASTLKLKMAESSNCNSRKNLVLSSSARAVLGYCPCSFSRKAICQADFTPCEVEAMAMV